MVSSILSLSTSQPNSIGSGGNRHSQQCPEQSDTKKPDMTVTVTNTDINPATTATTTTVCLTVFIFRGQPHDAWFHRHVVLYFTSPDQPGLHETVHTQYDAAAQTWVVGRVQGRVDWAGMATYLSHVNAGAVVVGRGQETDPMDVVASVSVRDRDPEWNCQHFVCEGLQALVEAGYQTREWYDAVEGEIMDKLLDGTDG